MKKSENFVVNMVFFVTVGVQTLEGFLLLETFFAKEKVVTVLAHVTVLIYLHFASKTFILLVVVDLRLKDYLHLVLRFVVSGSRIGFWALEVTFLT
jgi:hypothetical protein